MYWSLCILRSAYVSDQILAYCRPIEEGECPLQAEGKRTLARQIGSLFWSQISYKGIKTYHLYTLIG